MQTFMLRLTHGLTRRRRLVLVAWCLALLVSLPLAARQSDHLTGGGFEAPGSQSDSVNRALAATFPAAARASLAVVLVPAAGARPGDLSEALGSVDRVAGGVSGVRVNAPALASAEALARARPRRPVVLGLDIAGDETRATDIARLLRQRLGVDGAQAGRAAGGRVSVHVAGEGALAAAFEQEAKSDLAVAEARAFPLIAIVLLVAFGSLAGAALPLGLGFAAVSVSGAVIYLLSLTLEMSVFVTSMASMLGIGVAVDYSLFVLARYREEVAGGRAPAQARSVAMMTSGVAVLFSGMTVITALAGLFVVGSTALNSLAIGGIVVVAIAVLGAATLLPLLIDLLGGRIHEPGRAGRALARRRRPRPAAERFWVRWTELVTRRPAVTVVLASAFLLALAAPALDLRLANNEERQLPAGHEFLAGVRAAAAVLGPGALGPVDVLVRFDRGTSRDPANSAAITRLTRAIVRDPAVSRLAASAVAADGRSVLLTTLLDSDQESGRARAAVARLRGELPLAAGPAAVVEVGGSTATLVDFDHLVASSMWKIVVFVVGLSFIVLLVLLRSIVLALKAVLLNLLSVAAAYGVLVAVFEWGWLRFLGLQPAPTVDTITPPLVLAIAFGLSMDYEIFLLSRIRERYLATGDTRRAVAAALGDSAHTITSAAVVMVVVFLSFVSAGSPSVQRIGLAAAVAIGVDATIVRLMLVPAAMQLLGRWNWWLPRPLGRLIPQADFERLGPTDGPAQDAVLAESDR
jgi:uncharacterized membrane protein YdfJ with MMPL/SSD domain